MAQQSDKDDLPYMTISYANGLGYENNVNKNGGRKDLRLLRTESQNFTHPSTVPM